MESSTSPDFSADENELRGLANAEFIRRLKEEPKEIPSGQLAAFVAKVGFRVEPEKVEKQAIQTQNIFAILGGLPPERQEQILTGFQSQIDKARKELPRGG